MALSLLQVGIIVACILLLLLHGAQAVRLPPSSHPGTVRTIQSPDGDIVDCVLRHQQPAFNHPLLKNHTIQEFPTSIPIGFVTKKVQSIEEGLSYPRLQIWHQNETCPFGTIPILRRPTSLYKRKTWHHPTMAMYMEENKTTMHQNTSHPTKRLLLSPSSNPRQHEYATAQFDNGPIYGSHSAINVWNPTLQFGNEMSLAQMWIVAGKFEGNDLNSIEVGWQVNPLLHEGDRSTRFFTYWTSDFYTITGCYDLHCPGFVQVDSRILLGGAIKPISSYDGDQYDLGSLLVWKDPKTKNWWLYYNQIIIGYWPSTLFTHLAEHADILQWGGEIVNVEENGEHTSTQMGSGHFPSEGYHKSCYAHSLMAVDSTNNMVKVSENDLNLRVTRSECYNIQTTSYDNWGTTIFFGGPGRNPRCP